MSVRTLLVVAAAVAIFVGGAAVAASSSGSPASSFFDSLASHLGISTQKLADATKAAEIDQVDAALAAGRITQAQADAMKARINSSQPGTHGFGFGGRMFGGRPGFGDHGIGLRGYLSAAAGYLGISEQDLMQKLEQGQSLADVAKTQEKTVVGLEQAILDKAKSQLDQAVADKRITSDQETAILTRLKSMLDEIVNAAPGQHPFGMRPAWNGSRSPWNGAPPQSRWSEPRSSSLPVI